MSKLFKDLMESAEGMSRFLEGKTVEGLTAKTVEIVPLTQFESKAIKRLRARLKLSQAVFAGVIGVTDKAVQAWEAGTNRPNGPALRMIDLLARKPDEVLSEYLKRA